MSNPEIIDSLQLVPNAFRENSVMLMVTELLNALMDRNLNANYPDLVELQYAYYDAIYKMQDYSKISFEAKKQLMHEMGFDYIIDIINITEAQLTKLLMFLELIYILKGKEEGLRLILDTLGLVYEYTTWDETSPKGVPFTATLLITGGNYDDYHTLSRLKNFLRSYMLPWIDVVVQIVIDAPPLYVYPSYGGLIRLFDTTPHECSATVNQQVAIYDIDDGNGYDHGLYGRDTLYGTDGEVPDPPPPVEYVTFTISALPNGVAIVEINGAVRSSITVASGTEIEWRVYASGYEEQSGNFTITQDTSINVELVRPQYTFTINPTPDDALVTINGVVRTSITVTAGTLVSWEVSRTGYTTRTGNVTVNNNQTLVVSLTRANYTFTINPTPSNATVTINNVVRNSITVAYGTTVNWSVSASGYETENGSTTVSSNQTLNVSLTRTNYTLTINPTPSDATVTMNGSVRRSITVPSGTSVSWSVAADGYTTQSGTTVVNSSQTLNITLEQEETPLFRCYYIYFTNPDNPGSSNEFDTYAYVADGATVNNPLYFTSTTVAGRVFARTAQRANSSSELAASPVGCVNSSDQITRLFLNAPYISGISNGELTEARCTVSTGAPTSPELISTTVTALPQYNLSQ